MPVRILERLDGKNFHLRKTALVPGGLNFCFLLSGLCFILEGILLMGEVLFGVMTIRLVIPSALSYIIYSDNVELIIFAAYCFNYILVESLYVCIGFGIYINSRVEVEGWDLQLLFQKFAGSKSSAGRKKPDLKILILLCFLIFNLLGPASGIANADEALYGDAGNYFPAGFPSAGTEQLDMLEEILASRDFGGYREGWGIRFRYREDTETSDSDNASGFLFDELWVERIRRIFSYLLRTIVVLSALAFLVFVFYWYNNLRQSHIEEKPPDRGKTLSNPVLHGESPESLFSKAEDFFIRGNYREAWAACLSGYLGAYNKHHSLSFPADATEYGCLALLRKTLPAEAESFGELVDNWILFAYGGRNPARGAFEKALALGRGIGAGH